LEVAVLVGLALAAFLLVPTGSNPRIVEGPDGTQGVALAAAAVLVLLTCVALALAGTGFIVRAEVNARRVPSYDGAPTLPAPPQPELLLTPPQPPEAPPSPPARG
jgi:hypothetical protein